MRKPAALLALPIAAFLIAGCGSSGSSTSASTTSTGTTTSASSSTSTEMGVKISAKSVPNVGTVLVNSQGLTLYTFAPDMHSKVTCTSTCATVWPPLMLESGEKPVASGQVKQSLLGSDPDSEGGSVATYADWPLYTYVSDTSPGMASGQGLDVNGGLWYTISPSGKVIK
jgi:predicted lipoprotein with Yx(FWY)xxD motif